MGQVYQATDTKLNRQVALKILPEAFSADPDRLARFQREAQVLASLNHPNIAAIHGLEESEGTRALVLELVEGPTLADRIAQGAIPLDEALPIAKQMAEALEAAHEAGVIHRDLKPANIKVREDGTVKVLDFGLAKALETTPEGDPSQSPTLTAAATQMGVILGTAAYMSPEQARGKPVDRRADIWAFGVVVYEMLTGARPFQGEDVSLTLASVMKSDVDVKRLPPDLPETLRTVLHRCLEKDALQRIRDMGDVRLAMAGAFETTVSARPEPTAVPRLQIWQQPVPALIAVLLVAVFSVLTVWFFTQPGPQPVVRSTLVDPGSETIGNALDAGVALSPDGQRIVYFITPGAGGLGALYVRELDQLEPRLLAESARAPFFSPDGQWVGFKGDGAAPWMKVTVAGGPAVSIGGAETQGVRGASWGPDDAIVFATSDLSTGLSRVPAGGGETEVLTTPDSENGEVDHLFPEFLPGGNSVLFTITHTEGLDTAQIALLDLETGEHRTLIPGGSDARYVASGHIVYGVAGTLRAIPFDLDTLEVRGTPVPVVDGVTTRGSGAASFSVSPDGTLIYVVGGADSAAVQRFVWVDRNGRSDPIPTIPPGNFGNPRLSPDGERLLVGADGDLWIYDMATGRRSAITTDELTDGRYSAWSPDGSRVAYTSTRNGTSEVWLQPADGSGEPQQLTQFDGGNTDVESWSPNGEVLAFHHHGSTGADLFTIPLDAADPTPQPFLATEFAEEMTQFSPDGRFVAYLSDRTGERQVYIRPYPGPGAAVTVSIDGGVEPLWGRNGELFYRHPATNTMMGVMVSTEPTLTVGVPERLFDGQEYVGSGPGRSPAPYYDVTADGQRFLMKQDADTEGSGAVPSQIIMVQNWLDELTRLVPIP